MESERVKKKKVKESKKKVKSKTIWIKKWK